MALCLAHATAGYLVYEALRPSGPHRPALLAGAVLMANAPDLDFLPGILIGCVGHEDGPREQRGPVRTSGPERLVGQVPRGRVREAESHALREPATRGAP